jgi:glycosyltransferase involved in cell wall biosynthesis
VRITFVLPSFRTRPAGGFLVVYRYANELASRGHAVSIVHPRRVGAARSLLDRMKAFTWRMRKQIRWRGRPPWFRLVDSVNVALVPDLRPANVPNADAVFATASTTAGVVASYPAEKGRKLYLIQHYEDWLLPREELDRTWRLPMHKVVSSQWLREIGVDLGESSRLTHIPYGVELDLFRALIPPEERSPLRVGMLAHHLAFKGMEYGLAALTTVREDFPELNAVAFGAGARPESLPEWMGYVENPTRAELAHLYSSCAVFLHTSVAEGWGLTGAEAIACGCALVAADSGGVRDYAVDGKTALIVPPADPRALADRIIELIQDNAYRVELARSGLKAIQSFTWERAADRLERLIREVCDSSSEKAIAE